MGGWGEGKAVSPDVADLWPPWLWGVAAWGREGGGGAPGLFLAMPLSSAAFAGFYLFLEPSPWKEAGLGSGERRSVFPLGVPSYVMERNKPGMGL